MVQARKSDEITLAQMLIQFNVVDPASKLRATQYSLFERRYRDKQSYLEWRMAYIFSEEDLREGLSDLILE